jgi:hypothetical protein
LAWRKPMLSGLVEPEMRAVGEIQSAAVVS